MPTVKVDETEENEDTKALEDDKSSASMKRPPMSQIPGFYYNY